MDLPGDGATDPDEFDDDGTGDDEIPDAIAPDTDDAWIDGFDSDSDLFDIGFDSDVGDSGGDHGSDPDAFDASDVPIPDSSVPDGQYPDSDQTDGDEDVVDGDTGTGDANDTDLVTGTDIDDDAINDATDMDSLHDATQDTNGPNCPGEPGCPCDDGLDCFSGICIPTSDQSVCATDCFSKADCPKGWLCEPVPTEAGAPLVCVHPFENLCRPCVNDSECVPTHGIGLLHHSCIDSGPDGSFCGRECLFAWDCPDGYSCQITQTAMGPMSQCRPTGGTCECTAKFIESGFFTECYRQTGDARCFGTRTCDMACDAPFPAAESCNGVDDDCDGLTDEENATGCTNFFLDQDGDGYGTGQYKCLCAASGSYRTTRACIGNTTCDCRDDVFSVNPGATEICNNAYDDNCDGIKDTENAQGCDTYLYDFDGDGYGRNDMSRCLCAPDGNYRTLVGNDCRDDVAAVNPGAFEKCNNTTDDDCDGHIDNKPGDPNAVCNVCGDGWIDNMEACDHSNQNPGAACSGDCRSIVCGSEQYANITTSLGNTCYWRSTDAIARSNAETRCGDRGGYLVRMESASERDWVFDNLIFPPGSGSRVWIGARNFNGGWRWESGSEVGDEFVWRPGEPSGNGDCVQSSGSGVNYDDLPCTGQNRDYVCERPRVGTPR